MNRIQGATLKRCATEKKVPAEETRTEDPPVAQDFSPAPCAAQVPTACDLSTMVCGGDSDVPLSQARIGAFDV
jgi:hypothetical protein